MNPRAAAADPTPVAWGALGDRALCATTARLLSACVASLGALGLFCALVAAAVMLWRAAGAAPAASAVALSPATVLALAVVLALVPVERVLALRLRFDAGLFTDLACTGATAPVEGLAPGLDALDQALQTLDLRSPSTVVRPLHDRVRGARRLIGWHALTVGAQFTGLLPALVQTAGLGLAWSA